MNILILNWRDKDHPQSGGAEIVTHEHAKGWVKRGHSVTWFTSRYPNAEEKEIVDGMRIMRHGGALTVYPMAMQYVFFNGKKFDVIVDEVHGFSFFSPIFTRTPVVVFIHEIAGVIWDYMYPFPINSIGKFLEKYYFRFYKKCRFWTDASSTIEELVAMGIKKEQCTAIPCPISIDQKIVDQRLKNNIETNNQIPKIQDLRPKNQEPTYIFVSRVVKMKGIEEVIKAFAFIRKEQPDAALWIVGGGEPEYLRELRMMVEEYHVKDCVTFFGRVSEQEKLDLMRKAHILLHASVKEGWGLVVLEAASVGTPSVVYNVSGLRDVVKNRKTGIVLRNNSPQEMAKETLQLIGDKKRYSLYQTNGKIWVNSMQWEDVIKQSMKLLKEAVII